jgi:hypothetical protein
MLGFTHDLPGKMGICASNMGIFMDICCFFGNAMILVSKIYGLRNGKIDLQ